MSARLRPSRGFTLMEVMIAIAILALITGLTFQSFQGMDRLKREVEADEERDQAARAALNRMAREISMAFVSDNYDRKRYRQRPTLFRLKDGRRHADLIFTSFAHQRLRADAKEGDAAVFEYLMEAADDGKTSLMRRVNPVIDDAPDRGGTKAELADDIQDFSVQVWDSKSREWREEWDTNGNNQSTGQAPLPPRVKLVLTILGRDGKPKVYTTQAKITLLQPLEL